MRKSLDEMFALRDATARDKEWIVQLAEDLAEVTVSPLRGVWGDKAREFARESVTSLFRFNSTGEVRFLIATDRETDERVGYLILNMHHECPFEARETYIEDMGVVSDYLGKRVGHYLTDQAARISAEAGVDYLGAHISFSNRRALLAALSNGFELESYRIVRPCTDRAIQAKSESDQALERQDQNEKMRRTLLARRIKRRQRRQARGSRQDT